MRVTFLTSAFALGFCPGVMYAKDAELAHEVFIRSLKLGGQYTQVTYTNTRVPTQSGSLTSQSSILGLYGPVLGPGMYITPTRFFHLNLGLDLGALFNNTPFYNGSTTTLYLDGYANLGVHLGDVWPFAGLTYASYSLENSVVSAQGGVEYRIDSWLFGGLFSKSVSAPNVSSTDAYTNLQNWAIQIYATWLWGRWY